MFVLVQAITAILIILTDLQFLSHFATMSS